MSQAIDITAEQHKTVRLLIARYLPNTEAWVYGSRARWTSRPDSDLDMVVFATPDQARDVSDLREAFEESNLPFQVDLFVWEEVQESFREQIEREHVVLTEPPPDFDTNSSWAEVTFACLLSEPVRNGVYKPKDFHGRGVKMVNMGELFANPRLTDVPMRRVELTESEKRRFSVRKGDLLFARRSLVAEGAGKCCVALEVPESTAFESSIIRARPDPTKSDPLFLYYYFASPAGLHALDTIRRHVAVAGITGTDLANLSLVVPPPSQQREIARVLGTLDDKIELNRRMNETLEVMARALFKSWFVDFEPVQADFDGANIRLSHDICQLFPDSYEDSVLGNVPRGWKVTELTELIDINPRRPSLRKDESAPYVPMSSMPTSGHTPTEVSNRPFGSGTRFINGDTLVARITPCLENGKTAYVDFLQEGQVGWGSTEYIVLRPKPFLPSEFAYCLARSVGFRDFAIQSMTGTSGRQRVQPTALGQFLMPRPPKRIGKEFGKLTRPLISRARLSANESQALASLRDALLPKLISGEIRIADAEKAVEAVA